MFTVPTLAQTLFPYYAEARAALLEARAAWEDEARAYAAQGYRPHYCEHGTNLWVDWDPICGWCEADLHLTEELASIAWNRMRLEQEHRERTVLVDHFRAKGYALEY